MRMIVKSPRGNAKHLITMTKGSDNMQVVGANIAKWLSEDVIKYRKGSLVVAEFPSLEITDFAPEEWAVIDPRAIIESDEVMEANIAGHTVQVYVSDNTLDFMDEFDLDADDELDYGSFEEYCEEVYGATMPNNLAAIAGSIAYLNAISIAELLEKTSKEALYLD